MQRQLSYRRDGQIDRQTDGFSALYSRTHGSELRGQEEAGLYNEQVSYLQIST